MGMRRQILLMIASHYLIEISSQTWSEDVICPHFTVEEAEAGKDYSVPKVVRKEGQGHKSRSVYLQNLSSCCYQKLLLFSWFSRSVYG